MVPYYIDIDQHGEITSDKHITRGGSSTDFVKGDGTLDATKYAKEATKVEGTGYLEGGGDLSTDRTLDITQTIKNNIADGKIAHSWGDHKTEGYLKDSDLEGYATEDWVEDKGYITSYELPPASETTRGGIRIGEGLTIDDEDVLSTESVPIQTDISLYFDNGTKTIRSNIGDSKQRFIWNEGDSQVFELIDSPSITPDVLVQGQELDWLTQWLLDTENKTVTILDELDDGDLVIIKYKFIITE